MSDSVVEADKFCVQMEGWSLTSQSLISRQTGLVLIWKDVVFLLHTVKHEFLGITKDKQRESEHVCLINPSSATVDERTSRTYISAE